MVVWVVQRGFAEAGRFGWLFQRVALAVFGARKAASIVLLCDEWSDVQVHGPGSILSVDVAMWEPAVAGNVGPYNDGANQDVEREGHCYRHGSGCHILAIDGHATFLRHDWSKQLMNSSNVTSYDAVQRRRTSICWRLGDFIGRFSALFLDARWRSAISGRDFRCGYCRG